jgi:hypothetical protein
MGAGAGKLRAALCGWSVDGGPRCTRQHHNWVVLLLSKPRSSAALWQTSRRLGTRVNRAGRQPLKPSIYKDLASDCVMASVASLTCPVNAI